MIRQLTKPEEIPAGCVTDKGVVSTMHRETLGVTLERHIYPLKESKREQISGYPRKINKWPRSI